MERSDQLFAQQVRDTVDALRQGKVILYPTDTVWGIGCDATRADAVERIYRLKKRAEAKAMITLVDSEAMLERYVDGIPDVAYELLEAAVDPITVVYDRGVGVASNLPAPDGTLAVRLTHDPFCRAVIRALRRPLVSTSANISGMPAPRSFADISPEITAGVDYASLWRRDEHPSDSKPSTVIRLKENGEIKILRK